MTLKGFSAPSGDAARYDDEAWGEHYTGADGVRRFYEQLMKALPDLEIEVQHRHVTDDAVLVEVMIRVRTSESGVIFRRQGEVSSSRFAGCTHLTRMIVWPAKNLLRPRDGVETTRRFPRAAKRIGPNLHLRDSSDYDCTCFREETAAQVAS